MTMREELIECLVKIVDDDPVLYEYGKRRYHITLPVWWRPGVIALSFDEGV